MVEAMHEHARHVLIGKNDEQILPFFHIQFKDREDAIMPAPWSNEREKSIFIKAVRFSLKQFRSSVVNYAMISEAWMAEYDHKPGEKDLMPVDRESKKEVVIVSAGDHANARVKAWEIVRDDKGRVTDLVEDKVADRFEGRLFNLLADEDA
jgi:hypothetical protein